MAKETNSVGLSMGMLCMTMCFIYVVFFGMHGQSLQDELDALENKEGVYGIVSADEQEGTQQENMDSQVNNAPILQDIPVIQAVEPAQHIAQAVPENTVGRRFFSVQELFHENAGTPTQAENQHIYALSGTWQREGHMKSLDKTGLLEQQQYILKNMDNTHFVSLASVPTNFNASIEAKGGNVVEILDKNAINENQLFGDAIQFINLPEYKDIKVLMLVFFGGDIWFLQIDHDIYHARKQQLAATFAVRYDR